jgi:hypothetical protein
VIAESINRVILWGAALLLLGAGVCLSFLERVGGATTTYSAAGVCLIFLFLQEFKRVKLFGVEAELQDRIREANVLIEQLRALLLPISELLFSMVARAGRVGGHLPNRESYRIMSQFETELRSLGLTNEQIEKSKKEWHHFNMLDLQRPVLKDIGDLLHGKEVAQGKVLNSFKQPIPAGDPDHAAAIRRLSEIQRETKKLEQLYGLSVLSDGGPSHIQNFFKTCQLLSEDEKRDLLTRNAERLADLDHYEKHMEFRSLERWFQNDDD